MRIIRNIHGSPYAIQVWRFVFYAWDIFKSSSMRTCRAGIMTDFKGKRVQAEFWFWLICFVKFNPPNSVMSGFDNSAQSCGNPPIADPFGNFAANSTPNKTKDGN